MYMVQFRMIASLVLIIAFLPRLPLNPGEWLANLFAYAWLGLGVLVVLANGQQWIRMRKQKKVLQMAQHRKRLATQDRSVRSV